MISREELKKVFRLFRKHEDLLISAYLDQAGEIREIEDSDYSSIDALIHARLAWRPASNEPARLSRELSSLFERVLRDPRRMTLDANIGSFIVSLENSVNQYKKAVQSSYSEDATHYLTQIERLVDELRSSLIDSSGQLWQKINTEFGYVSSLTLKIKENEVVLSQAERINDGLELIKVEEMEELAGGDVHLRRYLMRWLLDTVETCRRETADAIHRLNELLFEFRQQQRLSRMVDAFYRRYQSNPGYTPQDYTASGSISEVFNQVASLDLISQANLQDPAQEITLLEIISGLRKSRPEIEEEIANSTIEVKPDQLPVEPKIPVLTQAVESFFLEVLEAAGAVSAMEKIPPPEIELDPQIWLYAIISRHQNMDETERRYFQLKFDETPDRIFDGRLLIHDINVSFRSV